MSQRSEVTINTSRDTSALPRAPSEAVDQPSAESLANLAAIQAQRGNISPAEGSQYRQLPAGRDWGYLGFFDTAAFENLPPAQRDFITGFTRIGERLNWSEADFEEVWSSRGAHARALVERNRPTNLLQNPRLALLTLTDEILTALVSDGANIPTNPRSQSSVPIVDLTRSASVSLAPGGHAHSTADNNLVAPRLHNQPHPTQSEVNRNTANNDLGFPMPLQQPPPDQSEGNRSTADSSVAPGGSVVVPLPHQQSSRHQPEGQEPLRVPTFSSSRDQNLHQQTPASTAPTPFGTHESFTPPGYTRLMGSVANTGAFPGPGGAPASTPHALPLATTQSFSPEQRFPPQPTPPTANTRLTATVLEGGLYISGGPAQSTPQIAARMEVARSGAALISVETLPDGTYHFSLGPEHVTLLLVDNQLPPETRRFALRSENREIWSVFASTRGLVATLTDERFRRILTGVMMGRMENTQVLNPQGPQLSAARLEAVAENIAFELVGRPQLTADTISAFAGAETNTTGRNRGGRRNHNNTGNNRRSNFNNAAWGGNHNNTNNNNGGGNGSHSGARRFNDHSQKGRGRGGK